MGKRYKPGNVGRRRKPRPKQVYFRREKQINNLINEFKKIVETMNMTSKIICINNVFT